MNALDKVRKYDEKKALTKAELVKAAKKLKVPGYSRMDKSALEKAVAKAVADQKPKATKPKATARPTVETKTVQVSGQKVEVKDVAPDKNGEYDVCRHAGCSTRLTGKTGRQTGFCFKHRSTLGLQKEAPPKKSGGNGGTARKGRSSVSGSLPPVMDRSDIEALQPVVGDDIILEIVRNKDTQTIAGTLTQVDDRPADDKLPACLVFHVLEDGSKHRFITSTIVSSFRITFRAADKLADKRAAKEVASKVVA
jgi:hypothetical protein